MATADFQIHGDMSSSATYVRSPLKGLGSRLKQQQVLPGSIVDPHRLEFLLPFGKRADVGQLVRIVRIHPQTGSGQGHGQNHGQCTGQHEQPESGLHAGRHMARAVPLGAGAAPTLQQNQGCGGQGAHGSPSLRRSLRNRCACRKKGSPNQSTAYGPAAGCRTTK